MKFRIVNNLMLCSVVLFGFLGCAMSPEQIQSEKLSLKNKYGDFYAIMSQNKELNDEFKTKFPTENIIIDCVDSAKCEDYLVNIEGAMASNIDYKVRSSTRAIVETFEPSEPAYKEYEIEEKRLEKSSEVIIRCLAEGKNCDGQPQLITARKNIRELNKEIGKTSAKAILETRGTKKNITISVKCLLPSQDEYNQYIKHDNYVHQSYKRFVGGSYPSAADSFDVYYNFVKSITSASSNNASRHASEGEIKFYDIQKDYALMSTNCIRKKLAFLGVINAL